MTQHGHWTAGGLALTIAVAAAVACGGDKITGPAACPVYRGGIVPAGGSLVGTYNLVSLCEDTLPSLPAVGTVTITADSFNATITSPPLPIPPGSYTLAATDSIYVVLLVGGTFQGTLRLRNDTLAVSGAAGSLKLSFVATRAP